MSWIEEIPYEEATGSLKKLYDKVKGPDENVDNILLAHSLRPHTLNGHMGLYKNVLHNQQNTLPKWYHETLGVYVSLLNQCDYCVHHHFEGLKRLLADDKRANEVLDGLKIDRPEGTFEGWQLLGIDYAKMLTQSPSDILENQLNQIRAAGLNDGEILEINQVVAYFNYANRMVLGLGINSKGDVLGLSPNDDGNPDDWGHK